MASFSVTAPKSIDATGIAIQDTSPDFSRAAKTFNATSPAGNSFTATALIQSTNFATGIPLPVSQPTEFADVVIRPGIGQVYPRTL